MIKLENITKIFKTEDVETIALNGVSFEINDGEFVSIMGPSGCGKSTLLSILGLLDNPTEGHYFINNTDYGKMKESQRTDMRKGNIGFIFQSFNLIDDLNVWENVELPLQFLGVPYNERKRRVEDILRKVKMSHRAKHYPQQLSGGQQQRTAIARAIVTQPKLLLADEPTGNLDSKNGLDVMELISQLNAEGTTVIMVTHSQHDATYANRIINMFDGQIVESVTKML
ncbi:MAG: ABC transporter ATP-binding protein [Bacteroidaceae bacterium]|nr:ABC transporter ATP-binding protein [Bacteroidaceae bacterium]